MICLTVRLRTRTPFPFPKKTGRSQRSRCRSISISKRDAEIAVSLTHESTACHSHLMWLTDLLLVLTKRLEQPNAVIAIQPMLTKILQHQKWVQVLLTNSLTILASNAILVRRDLPRSSISGQFPKDTLKALRNSPLLRELIFYISPEDLESLKKRRNKRYMFKVLKQVAQLKQSQPPEFKILKSKPLGSAQKVVAPQALLEAVCLCASLPCCSAPQKV